MSLLVMRAGLGGSNAPRRNRSLRERGASAPCFPECGKASAISAGAETADSRPLLAGDPKAFAVVALGLERVVWRAV